MDITARRARIERVIERFTGQPGGPFAAAALAGTLFPNSMRLAERWGALQMLAPRETLDAIQTVGRTTVISASGLIEWALPVYRRGFATREEVMQLIDALPSPKTQDLIAAYRSGSKVDIKTIDTAIRATASALSS